MLKLKFFRLVLISLSLLIGLHPVWAALETAETVLPAPKLSDITQNSVQIHWEPTAKATRYELSFGIDTDASNRGSEFVSGTAHTLRKLMANTIYRVKIRAIIGGRAGAWSALGEFSTQIPPVDGLSVTEVSDTTVRLSWSGVFSDLADTVFEVACGKDTAATSENLASTSTNSLVLKNLIPQTNYLIKLRARTPKRTGPWNQPISVLTLPPAPHGLTVASSASDSADIIWKSLPGGNRGYYYQVSWGTDANAANRGATVTAAAESILTALSPESRYFVRVRVANALGASPWSTPLAFVTLPAGLTDVRVSNIKNTTARVEWSQVADATGYEISYALESAAKDWQVFDMPYPPSVLESLEPNQRYIIKIRPVFGRQNGTWSETVRFATFSVPPSPIGLTASADSAVAQLRWQSVPEAATYELLVTTEEFSEKGRSQISNRTEAQIFDLPGNTVFYAKVRALNSGGSGPWSGTVQGITPPKTAPANATLSNISTESALLHWDFLPGPVEATYEIRWAQSQQAWHTPATCSGQTLSLDTLAPETAYQVQVRAQNRAGYGPWSSILEFKTLKTPPQNAPAGLRVEAITDTSATVLWNAMDRVNGYCFSLGSDIDAADQKVEKLTQTKFLLAGLAPHTSYFAKVKAYNQTGEGPWSEILLVPTLPSPPISAPPCVLVDQVTPTSFRLSWDADADAMNYELGLEANLHSTNGEIKTISVLAYIFSGLKPNTIYYAHVRKVNRGGSGPWSQMQRVVTLAGE